MTKFNFMTLSYTKFAESIEPTKSLCTQIKQSCFKTFSKVLRSNCQAFSENTGILSRIRSLENFCFSVAKSFPKGSYHVMLNQGILIQVFQNVSFNYEKKAQLEVM